MIKITSFECQLPPLVPFSEMTKFKVILYSILLKDRQHLCITFKGVISQLHNQEALSFLVQRKKEQNSLEIQKVIVKSHLNKSCLNQSKRAKTFLFREMFWRNYLTKHVFWGCKTLETLIRMEMEIQVISLPVFQYERGFPSGNSLDSRFLPTHLHCLLFHMYA